MFRFPKDVGLMAIPFCLIALGAYYWFGSPERTRVIKLRLTAGDGSGLRHRLALEFAREASKSGIEISVEPTDGSEQALERLSKREFDIAMVQGGLRSNSESPIRQVSALHIEPLHLLVKPEWASAINDHGLTQLAGKRLNLGSLGSGTHALATEVLHFAGLTPEVHENDVGESHFQPNSLNYAELLKTELQDLPDAVFSVSTLPSPIADFLIDRYDYRLVPLLFGEALALQSSLELGGRNEIGSVDKQHIYTSSIPAYTYRVDPASPPRSLQTIGTRLLLVAHQNVGGEEVKRLLECLYQSDFIKTSISQIDASLLDLPTEFPLHRGSELYRQRNKPIIAGDAIDYLEKVLAITATIAGGTFFVVQWYLRSNRRRRESSFASYMERVISIENEAMQNELASQLDLASLIRLQRELSVLKSEAVSRFAAGKLEGEGLIHGFLALVNDARNQLTRLILHQRENIEQLAATQNHTVDEVWTEQSKSQS